MKSGNPCLCFSLVLLILAFNGCESTDRGLSPKTTAAVATTATPIAKEVGQPEKPAPLAPSPASVSPSVVPSLVQLKRSDDRIPLRQLIAPENPPHAESAPIPATAPAPAPSPAKESQAKATQKAAVTPASASIANASDSMIGWIVGGGLVLLVGAYVAYRSSEAVAINRDVGKLRSDLEALISTMEAEAEFRYAAVQAAGEAHRDATRKRRMAAVSLDDIRQLAAGARMQPLRDLGMSSLLDCHTWDVNRFMALRGIGPDSAYKLAAACAVLKKGIHEQRIPHPDPSNNDPIARGVFERIHEQLRSRDILNAPRDGLITTKDAVMARCFAVEERTTFWPWLFGSAKKGKLMEALQEGKAILGDQALSQTMDAARCALGEARSTRAPADFDASQEAGARPEYILPLEQLFGPASKTVRKILPSFVVEPPPIEPVLIRPGKPAPPNTIRNTGYRIEINLGSDEPDHVTGVAPADCWIGFGEAVTVHGKRIEGPLYVGQGLRAASGRSVEPALIDPNLPVADNADFRVRMLDYWSNYSHATSQARASYLEWLADGKQAPEADVGYAYLYFYGLERRALADESAAAKADIPNIVAEVERLHAIYARNRSFGGYSTAFLNYLAATGSERSLDEPPALTRYDLPFTLRLRLGQFAAAKQPLPAQWAHAWHYCDPRTRLPAAAERCPELAKKLFELRYNERFGEGLSLPGSRTRIKMTYRPASASFASTFVHALDLPDVTVMTSVYTKIDQLAADCFKELDPYSRYIWRNRDDTGSAEARLLLPAILWEKSTRDSIEAQVATSEDGNPLTLKEVFGLFGGVERPTRAQYRALTLGLVGVGVGIEPDLRFTNDIPSMNDPIALFRCEDGEALGAGFPTASLIVQLAGAAATADGEFSDGEAKKVRQEISRLPDLTTDGRRRLAARVATYRVKPPATTGLKAAIAPLDGETRLKVAEIVLGVISGAGEIEHAEVKMLEKIFALLGLDATILYGRLHGLAVSPTDDRADAPPRVASGPLRLDSAKIAKLKATSDEVTQKLAAIFDEDTAPTEAPADEPSTPVVGTTNPLGLALDQAHGELVALIVTRAQWTRAEFEEVCADKGLMPDGAIESLNEAAFEEFNQPLIDGEDPLEISLHLEKATAA